MNELKTYGYELIKTCGCCPEQYDVIDKNGEQIGYLRLRHGYFRAEVPGCCGSIVYDANPNGDGMFEDDERQFHLQKALDSIHQWNTRKGQENEI
jgi:hypothetical protein